MHGDTVSSEYRPGWIRRYMGTYRYDPERCSQRSNHVTLSREIFLPIGDLDVKSMAVRRRALSADVCVY